MRDGERLPLILVLLLALAALGFAPEEEEPTPAERIAELKTEYARRHADLGSWAAGKKLGKVAGAHFRLALRLDPECRRARSRLGYRRTKSGEWELKREKEWEYGEGAVEKHGEALRQKEAALLEREVAAFEELGLALKSEGHAELARPLLLRVHLLAPQRDAAAEALGLTKLFHGHAEEAVAKRVRVTPSVRDAGRVGFLSRILGMTTVTRHCGGVLAETVGDRGTAEDLARVCEQAQVLTSARFGLTPHTGFWATLVVADTRAQFDRFVESCGAFGERWVGICKKLGTARAYSPRYFCATFGGSNARALFTHAVAEDVLCFAQQGCPAWLHESAAMDASLTLLGSPGTVCVTYEESLGLRMKDPLKEPQDWGRQLLRRAGMEDFPRLELLVLTQLAALGREDLIPAHAYYRYLLRTHRPGLAEYLGRIGKGEKPDEAIEGAFGTKPGELEAEFLSVLCGDAK